MWCGRTLGDPLSSADHGSYSVRSQKQIQSAKIHRVWWYSDIVVAPIHVHLTCLSIVLSWTSPADQKCFLFFLGQQGGLSHSMNSESKWVKINQEYYTHYSISSVDHKDDAVAWWYIPVHAKWQRWELPSPSPKPLLLCGTMLQTYDKDKDTNCDPPVVILVVVGGMWF